MIPTYRRSLIALFAIVLLGKDVPSNAQIENPLPIWKAIEQDVAKLGEEFSDSKIRIRPPQNLKKVELETSPEIAKARITAYGWTPGGVFPSATNLSIALGPLGKPSSVDLDETIAGMKKSIERNSESIEFSEVKQGMFRGMEARSGSYTAQISDKRVRGFYLVGIDKAGTFAVSAMIPSVDATPEKIKLLRASMLTFKRAE
jgi:hypothetical protein